MKVYRLTSVLIVCFVSKCLASGRTGEVCFPVGGHVTDEPQPEIVQGYPGKRGGSGPPGLQGPPGPPGQCGCDPNEVEQLREEMRVLNRTIERRIREAVDALDPKPTIAVAQPSDCDVPNPPQHGRVSTNLPIIPRGESITYSCDDGYGSVEHGTDDVTVTCQDSGNWSEERPTCDRCTVGMEDRRITDAQLSSSSTLSSSWQPRNARLNNQASPACGWHPRALSNYRGEWVQIDLERSSGITGVITQGYCIGNEWITSYKISYGNSTSQMQFIQGNNGDMIFQGNRDGNTPVTNRFSPPIYARYIRLIVETSRSGPILRMEYLTC